MSFKKSTGGVFAACLLATLILGCSPAQLAELEPLPETIVNDLTTREKALWDASQQKDTKRLKQLLADEYVAVSDRGPLDKAGAIAYVREPISVSTPCMTCGPHFSATIGASGGYSWGDVD